MELMGSFPREHRLKGFIYDYPSFPLALIVAYIIFVVKIGPDFMRNRKPYNLRMVARIYNIFQVAANIGFLVTVSIIGWRSRGKGRFGLFCSTPTTEQPDLETEGDTELLASACTFYLYVRFSDFLDTVLFILMKKFSHVSFLHVYHHVSTVMLGYVYLRSGWGTLMTIGGFMNANIHVLMYTYYFLATFPSMRPYLWWKRHLTLLQIVQFVIMAIQVLGITVSDCGYPRAMIYFNCIQVSVVLSLFTKFYVETYVMKSSKSPNAEAISHRKDD